MSALRLAVTVVSVAATIAQHPMVRAAAPHVLNPRNKEVAINATLSAAYNAGVLTRRIRQSVTGK